MAMLKKIGFLAVLIVGGLVLWNSSYASLGWKKAKEAFKAKVSPETRIELIREDVGKLSKEMKKHINVVAAETVAVDNLRAEVVVAERNLKDQLSQIVALKK